MSAPAVSHPATAPVRIGTRPIGAGAPAYVIAEAGVNHNGDVGAARRMIEVAAEAGADAVKFQVFRAAELTCGDAPTAAYQRGSGGGSQRTLLERLELAASDLAALREHCERYGVEFLATPFAVSDARQLGDLGVRAVKLASTDLNHPPLVRAAVDLNVPVIASVGAATADEIAAAVARFGELDARQRLILLHCVSAYPTPLDAANLGAIGSLRERFGVPVGYSDHTQSTLTGGWAVAAGACVLEKHFTLSRRLPGPDQAMSLEPEALRLYIATIRDAEAALGSGTIGMTALEEDVRQVARRSVVMVCGVRAGTVLTAEMLTTKRPGTGIPADQLDAVIGRRIGRDVAADTLLAWDMLT